MNTIKQSNDAADLITTKATEDALCYPCIFSHPNQTRHQIPHHESNFILKIIDRKIHKHPYPCYYRLRYILGY